MTTTLHVPSCDIDRLYSEGSTTLDAASTEAAVNEHVILRAGTSSALARHTGRGRLQRLLGDSADMWGIAARSKEQRFATDLLLDPDVKVVALDGPAGTGKTLLALAAGLDAVVEQREHSRLIVYRPTVTIRGANLGFLPGDLAEKLDPWMTAITDVVEATTSTHDRQDAEIVVNELRRSGQLSMESVAFLRGRTLRDAWIVVDEAQNLEPSTLKTVLTRVGENAKIVFTGDTSQVDASYLSEDNNAVSRLIQAFTGQSIFGHVRLTKCERSEVAALASKLLTD